MTEQPLDKEKGKKILGQSDHPVFGKMVEFEDIDGLGIQVGEGEDSFIVRPLRPGHVKVEGAKTEEAIQKAKRLMGHAVDRRGGHI